MKKIIYILVAFFAFVVIVSPVSAAKPNSCATIQGGTIKDAKDNPISVGYDQWGYNYQAHMFNGFYDNYSKPSNLVTEGDWLQMKWNDAWLSNMDCDDNQLLDRHFGYPDGYPGSGAWLTNHMRGTYDGINYTWDIGEDWVLDFAGGTENREFRNLVKDTDGNVTGEFWWDNSGIWEYGGTLVGTLDEDHISLYYDRTPIAYTGEFGGTIGDNVITNGTFTDSHSNNLTWTATGISSKTYEVCEWDYFVKIVTPNPTSFGTDYNDGGVWFNEEGVEIGPAIWTNFAIVQEVENDICGGLEGLQYKSFVTPGLGYYGPGEVIVE